MQLPFGRKRPLLVFLPAITALLILLAAPSLKAQLSTADHLADPGFWPTQTVESRSELVGAAECANCHAGIAATQRTTAMAGTAMRATQSSTLASHNNLHFSFGPFRYEIKVVKDRPTYRITDGQGTEEATLLWAFGTNRVGQSYLFKQADGNFHEARVTYFKTLDNLHFTPARALTSVTGRDEAMFRVVPDTEVSRCFSCHTTGSNIAGKFEENKLEMGIACEACHGPGAKHVAAMQAAKFSGADASSQDTEIFNTAKLSPSDAVDFCGACHGTFWDVKLDGSKGVANAKFQPFRLEESKCWGKGDARLTCVACHNPHEPLQTETASYDGACLKCHASGGVKVSAEHFAKGCPVAQKNCVTCHMPKVNVPDLHYDFTDHRIQIVRAGQGFVE